ncbi:MAG TPA: hypothetical protein VFU28_12935, partial [Vicinamibacterales bacterium]|nr:hypothetical protein [Vicinamibacterales bacterium]
MRERFKPESGPLFSHTFFNLLDAPEFDHSRATRRLRIQTRPDLALSQFMEVIAQLVVEIVFNLLLLEKV